MVSSVAISIIILHEVVHTSLLRVVRKGTLYTQSKIKINVTESDINVGMLTFPW